MVGDKIRTLRESRGLSQEELGIKLGVKKAAISKWENGIVNNLKRETIKQLSELFHVDPSLFFEDETTIKVLCQNNVYDIPLYESVSAGFGVLAQEYSVGYFPTYIKCADEAQETLCIKVAGNSMYPKIENGDIIQVHKQSSVDSGDIAVVLVDDADGFVKKVLYGDNWIELHSINPEYQTKRFEGADVQRIKVVGKVKKIIKEC